MLLTIDTNVLYQALRSTQGASHYILSLIRKNNLFMALSIQVFNEYEEVLKRPKSLEDLELTVKDVEAILRFIAFTGKPYDTYFLFRPNLIDKRDNIFVELAIACNADYLITNNVKDFTTKSDLKFDDLTIITPSDFVKMWRNRYEE